MPRTPKKKSNVVQFKVKPKRLKISIKKQELDASERGIFLDGKKVEKAKGTLISLE